MGHVWLVLGIIIDKLVNFVRSCQLVSLQKKKSKAKQRCVMCLYAQLVQTNNTWCKSAIIMRYHPYLSGFCSRPRLTQHAYNISWCCQNLSSLLLKVSVVAADITISGKLFQTLTILGAKQNFLKS